MHYVLIPQSDMTFYFLKVNSEQKLIDFILFYAINWDDVLPSNGNAYVATFFIQNGGFTRFHEKPTVLLM